MAICNIGPKAAIGEHDPFGISRGAISLIVKVEDEFNIIFEDDKLDMTKFPDILSLFSYIQQQTNKTR